MDNNSADSILYAPIAQGGDGEVLTKAAPADMKTCVVHKAQLGAEPNEMTELQAKVKAQSDQIQAYVKAGALKAEMAKAQQYSNRTSMATEKDYGYALGEAKAGQAMGTAASMSLDVASSMVSTLDSGIVGEGFGGCNDAAFDESSQENFGLKIDLDAKRAVSFELANVPEKDRVAFVANLMIATGQMAITDAVIDFFWDQTNSDDPYRDAITMMHHAAKNFVNYIERVGIQNVADEMAIDDQSTDEVDEKTPGALKA